MSETAATREPSLVRWSEPTRAVPLAWGSWNTRSLAAIGALAVASALWLAMSAFVGQLGFLMMLLVGAMSLASVGWILMPTGTAGRALTLPLVLAPAILGWIPWVGPLSLTFPFIAWLAARRRPAEAFATVTIVLAAAIVAGRLTWGPDAVLAPVGALGVTLGGVVLATWAARAVAVMRHRRRGVQIARRALRAERRATTN